MIFLVTGGAGFIGSHTVELLLKQNHKVIVIDNESAKSNSKFYWDDRAANYKLDICDYDSIRPLFEDVDYVIHLAAQSRIQPSLLDPTETMQTNVFGTANVLRCAREAGVKRVVFASSSSVYGDGPLPNKEDNEPNPLSPYAHSKLWGEEMCKFYNDELGLQTIILRYFNVYGDRQPDNGPYATILSKFEEQYMNDLPLTVVGDGKQRRDFTWVGDVARANIAALKFQSPERLGVAYNIGTGRNYSVNEIVKMFKKAKKIKLDKRSGESLETLADLNKTGRAIGWVWSRYLESYISSIVRSKRNKDYYM